MQVDSVEAPPSFLRGLCSGARATDVAAVIPARAMRCERDIVGVCLSMLAEGSMHLVMCFRLFATYSCGQKWLNASRAS